VPTGDGGQDLERLYKGRRGAVEFVEVPSLSFAVVHGEGDPDGQAFAEAIQALYAVSYAAHFGVKKRTGVSTRVMPLEALWWADDPEQAEIVKKAAMGEGSLTLADRSSWRWQAMIVQPDPIEAKDVERALDESRTKGLPALGRLTFEEWEEGRCAQTLHVGPYAQEAPTIVRLHAAIDGAGLRPRGRHHEIYLGDPRRSAPEKLRTLIRHPVQ
jgi:hypothetical protein